MLDQYLNCFLFCHSSWESLWLRNCAEIASTAALSISRLYWTRNSWGSIQTPSRRKLTSWRWLSTSWNRSSSSIPPPAPLQPMRATPGACRKLSTSCPSVRCRHSPREDCWVTSYTCCLQWTRAPESSLSPALQSATAAAKRKLHAALHSGGPGRAMWTLLLLTNRIPLVSLWLTWTVILMM